MQIHLSASEKLWKRPAVPTAAVLGLLVNPNNPNAEADSGDLQAAAHALGRRLYVLTASTDHEIETAFAAAVEQKVGALFINIDSEARPR
jgi:ABC-type uncharacterized transport system substrate-binding protein